MEFYRQIQLCQSAARNQLRTNVHPSYEMGNRWSSGDDSVAVDFEDLYRTMPLYYSNLDPKNLNLVVPSSNCLYRSELFTCQPGNLQPKESFGSSPNPWAISYPLLPYCNTVEVCLSEFDGEESDAPAILYACFVLYWPGQSPTILKYEIKCPLARVVNFALPIPRCAISSTFLWLCASKNPVMIADGEYPFRPPIPFSLAPVPGDGNSSAWPVYEAPFILENLLQHRNEALFSHFLSVKQHINRNGNTEKMHFYVLHKHAVGDPPALFSCEHPSGKTSEARAEPTSPSMSTDC